MPVLLTPCPPTWKGQWSIRPRIRAHRSDASKCKMHTLHTYTASQAFLRKHLYRHLHSLLIQVCALQKMACKCGTGHSFLTAVQRERHALEVHVVQRHDDIIIVGLRAMVHSGGGANVSACHVVFICLQQVAVFDGPAQQQHCLAHLLRVVELQTAIFWGAPNLIMPLMAVTVAVTVAKPLFL